VSCDVLAQISRHALLLEHSEEARAHLSDVEAKLCTKYARNYVNHLQREVWDQENAKGIPASVKDVTKNEQLMRPPDYNRHVFCIAMRDCPTFTLENTTDAVTLMRGEVALLPYSPLRPLIEAGDVLLT
jgi:hypothetical protein